MSSPIDYFPCDDCKEPTDAYWESDEHGTGVVTGPNSSLWGPWIFCGKCNKKYIDMHVAEEEANEREKMSHWNHRVLRRKLKLHNQETELVYGIVEAYYNDENEVDGWTESFMDVSADDIDGLKLTLERMLMCLKKPIIDEEEELAKSEARRELRKNDPPEQLYNLNLDTMECTPIAPGETDS